MGQDGKQKLGTVAPGIAYGSKSPRVRDGPLPGAGVQKVAQGSHRTGQATSLSFF